MSIENVYDNPPPRHGFLRLIIAVVICILAGCIFHSCNIIKKWQEAHDKKKIDKISLRNPDVLKKELAHLFPPDTIIKFKQGQVITKTVKVVDSSKLKDLTNKLSNEQDKNKLLQNIIANCKDSVKLKQILDSVKQSTTDEVLRGCGTFEQDTVYSIRVDTIYNQTPQVKAQLALLPIIQNESLKKDQKIEDLTSYGNKWMFVSILEFVLVLLLTYLLIKSFLKQKAKTIV